MILEQTTIQAPLAPGPRYALDACALLFGPIHGPTLLFSAMPYWERALRRQIGDQLFTLEDPARPSAQPWLGAIWLEPQNRTWQHELEQILAELPSGGLLAIVMSLPQTMLQRGANRSALGLRPTGVLRLRRALLHHGCKVERTFGFQTVWWSALRWIVTSLRLRRPDWSDRLQFVMQRSFATHGFALPLAATGLIQARAGTRS